MQVVEHCHMQFEIVHGDVPVFRHDEIEAHEAWIGLGQLETQQYLGEDHLAGQPAQYLVEIAYPDIAPWICFPSSTLQYRAHFALVIIEPLAGSGNNIP